MPIFRRLRRLAQATIQEVLEQAENPQATLDAMVLELCEHLERARGEVATAMAEERQLARQATEAEQAAQVWAQRARRAVDYGADELAREALRRQCTAEELAGQLRGTLEEQGQAVARLRTALDYLERRLRDARIARTRLQARAHTVNAQQAVARILRETIGEDAVETFDRIAARLETGGQHAQALTELRMAADSEDTFALADQHARVERELQQLKDQRAALPPVAESPALARPDEA